MEVVAVGFALAPFQGVLKKLGSVPLNQIALIHGVDDNFRKLKSALGRVQFMLEYLENHVGFINISLNEALKRWIQDVERSSYRAEDFIDEICLELSKRHDSHNLLDDRLRGMVLRSPGKLLAPNQIKKFQNKLEAIAKEIESLSLFMPTIFPELDPHAIAAKSSSTYFGCSSSLMDGSAVVGRNDEIDKMICRLLDEEELKVSVIPIVGMGGIGKTTLAQVVYNDSRVRNKFQLEMWVTISPNFDVVRIIKSIIQSVTETYCKISDLHVLQVKLQESLKQKSFLLVLDDFWSDKHEDWDILFSTFRDGHKGSKVIVTTRSEKVASIVSSYPTCYIKGNLACYLEGLTDDECWELMKQKAFSSRHEEIRDISRHVEIRDLEAIGKDIAKKCKGLPLAAKTLGSMLNFKPTAYEWNSILESELWALPEGKNGIFQSLALSYYYMPEHLKRCFAYCSIFPRHHEFQVDELVLLWMAQGFIRPKGKIRLEDIGKEYFMELMWRSFFQFSHDLPIDGYVKHIYKMHDLIYDMAYLVSSGACIRKEHNLSIDEFSHPRHLSLRLYNIKQVISSTTDLYKSLRTFSFGWNNSSSDVKTPDWYKRLRTFSVVCDDSSVGVKLPDELFRKLKSIRVLSLRNSGIDELPGSIKHLKHLRYLKLSEKKMKNLPKEITELYALETLKIEECQSLLSLPDSFSNLTNLRHLDLGERSQLIRMPSDLGRLSNLQTLSDFVVGREKRNGIAELRNMQFLKGSICIRNLENVQNAEDAEKAMLDEKPSVEKLKLEWKSCDATMGQEVNILGSLKPHKNVMRLVMKNYSGYRFPDWLGDRVLKLRSIALESCPNCNTFPFLGQLPLLNSLYIVSMPKLVSLDGQFRRDGDDTAFPSLEVLEFKNMQGLKEWKELKNGDMPCLQKLSFEKCQILSDLPPLHNLEKLEFLTIILCPELSTSLQLRDSVKVRRVEKKQRSREETTV